MENIQQINGEIAVLEAKVKSLWASIKDYNAENNYWRVERVAKAIQRSQKDIAKLKLERDRLIKSA